MKYRIASITDLEWNDRTDGRYPQRINSLVDILYAEPPARMVMSYIEDGEGAPKTGILRTSSVKSIDNAEKYLVVTTRNSIYRFRKMGDGEDC